MSPSATSPHMAFKSLQGQWHSHCPGQPVPGLENIFNGKIFPNTQSKPLISIPLLSPVQNCSRPREGKLCTPDLCLATATAGIPGSSTIQAGASNTTGNQEPAHFNLSCFDGFRSVLAQDVFNVSSAAFCFAFNQTRWDNQEGTAQLPPAVPLQLNTHTHQGSIICYTVSNIFYSKQSFIISSCIDERAGVSWLNM